MVRSRRPICCRLVSGAWSMLGPASAVSRSSPGAILTPLVQATLSEQGGAAALANRAPLGRLGHPDEIAAATLWMCSSAASFVTATDLLVDGGIDAFAAFADPYAPVSPPPPSAFISPPPPQRSSGFPGPSAAFKHLAPLAPGRLSV
jgi:hypothetical protein